jgi:hypothetical protein
LSRFEWQNGELTTARTFDRRLDLHFRTTRSAWLACFGIVDELPLAEKELLSSAKREWFPTVSADYFSILEFHGVPF